VSTALLQLPPARPGLSEPCRVADGRRLYRLRRRRAVDARRCRLAALLAHYGWAPGAVARAARDLGVSLTTAYEDARAIRAANRCAARPSGGP
jgi:hypothetical protein